MEEKKYTGKPRGGSGLGQGRKKKNHQSRTFTIHQLVCDLIDSYAPTKGYKKGKRTELVEIALIDFFMDNTNRNIPDELTKNFKERKQNFLI